MKILFESGKSTGNLLCGEKVCQEHQYLDDVNGFPREGTKFTIVFDRKFRNERLCKDEGTQDPH
jgi:hypothetical protein